MGFVKTTAHPTSEPQYLVFSGIRIRKNRHSIRPLARRERHGVGDLLPELLVDRRDHTENRLAGQEIENRPGGGYGKGQLHPAGIARTVPFWDVLR